MRLHYFDLYEFYFCSPIYCKGFANLGKPYPGHFENAIAVTPYTLRCNEGERGAPPDESQLFQETIMFKFKQAAVIAVLAAISLEASATMEAAFTSASDGELVHHSKPACPNFILIKHKDGTTEEHIYAKEVVSGRSSVDDGECVFY